LKSLGSARGMDYSYVVGGTSISCLRLLFLFFFSIFYLCVLLFWSTQTLCQFMNSSESDQLQHWEKEIRKNPDQFNPPPCDFLTHTGVHEAAPVVRILAFLSHFQSCFRLETRRNLKWNFFSLYCLQEPS